MSTSKGLPSGRFLCRCRVPAVPSDPVRTARAAAKGVPPVTRVGPALLLLVSLLPLSLPADETPVDPEQAEARLEEVRDRIRAITRRISEDRHQRDQLASELHQTERRSSTLAAELADVEQRLSAKRQNLKGLEQDRDARRSAVARQLGRLRRHIQAAYALGRQDRLKLLLNQEDPAAVSRTFTYYEYFNRARARRIETLRQEIAELGRIEAGIRRETDELGRLRQKKSEAMASLKKQHSKRRETLAKLNARIRQGGAQVERLKEDERRLTALVKKLEQELADLALPLDIQQRAFAELKGMLPWPISGRVRHGFGAQREDSGLTWRGVVIEGNRGEPVRAISHGRVAFADWLRGFGFLMIVDHGGGYMSLYGHTETLRREVGDWVQAGEVIATVGDSGGQADAALYFEIRHNGVPTNPAGWCSRAATAALVGP